MAPHDPSAGPGGPPPGPGWVNPEIQQRIAFRDDDIVISVPGKSGTTWTMNIVHQLREGGDPDLHDVYAEVPWIEFVPHPKTTVEDVVARIDDMPPTRRRAFKSHSAPPTLPFHAAGSGKDVKYVVVGRNPEEAIVSMFPFLGKHAESWFELWGVPKAALVPPTFGAFFEGMGKNVFAPMIFGFVASWWQLRNEPNVLMLHFSDMKADHEGSVRKIANFLGYEPSAQQWPKILEYTSFSWMKANEGKFEGKTLSSDTEVLESGAMIRKGKVGAAHEDGMTPDIAGTIRGIGQEMVRDADALRWIYEGGES